MDKNLEKGSKQQQASALYVAISLFIIIPFFLGNIFIWPFFITNKATLWIIQFLSTLIVIPLAIIYSSTNLIKMKLNNYINISQASTWIVIVVFFMAIVSGLSAYSKDTCFFVSSSSYFVDISCTSDSYYTNLFKIKNIIFLSLFMGYVYYCSKIILKNKCS